MTRHAQNVTPMAEQPEDFEDNAPTGHVKVSSAAAVEWFTILERLGSSIYKMDQSDPLVIEAKEQFLKIATSMTKETMGI